MIKMITKELVFFAILIIALALVQHQDLLTQPAERFTLMSEKENYLHPLLWAGVIYFVLLVIRLILKFVLKLFRTKA